MQLGNLLPTERMLDRRTPPAFTNNLNFGLIEPEIATLPGGTPVYFVKGGEQNVLKVELVFPAGRWNEPVQGAAHFSSKLLARGTTSRTSFEIASRFDQLGAHFDTNAGPDYATMSLYSLGRNLGASLDLALELLIKPSFDDRELEQLKSVYIQNLKVSKEKTAYLASRLFRKSLFGEDHPYGREIDEEEVKALQRADLIRFHEQWFGPVLVIVSGRIDLTNQEKIISALSGIAVKKNEDAVHETVDTVIPRAHIGREGSLQTSLRIGCKALPRTHPGFPALIFLNHILGGYFGSRLMKNIREDKGLTYGIHSSVHIMVRDSYLVIGTDVNRENTTVARSEIGKELERLCAEEIPSEELETARHHFIGSLQAELATPFAHADKIRNIALYNLDKGHYTNLIEKIDQMSATDLIATANQYFRKASFIEASAG